MFQLELFWNWPRLNHCRCGQSPGGQALGDFNWSHFWWKHLRRWSFRLRALPSAGCLLRNILCAAPGVCGLGRVLVEHTVNGIFQPLFWPQHANESNNILIHIIIYFLNNHSASSSQVSATQGALSPLLPSPDRRPKHSHCPSAAGSRFTQKAEWRGS